MGRVPGFTPDVSPGTVEGGALKLITGKVSSNSGLLPERAPKPQAFDGLAKNCPNTGYVETCGGIGVGDGVNVGVWVGVGVCVSVGVWVSDGVKVNVRLGVSV